MKIRTLIVDDEAPARNRLRQLLETEADFEIVGECANGRQAVAALQKQKPDLVFLDVQMPRLDGFQVCAEVGLEDLPLVVFVTAYNQFALQAFEVHALDYLLKPFDRERFQKTLRHVREQFQRGHAHPINAEIKSLLEDLRSGGKKLERLAFKTDGRVLFVRVEEIDWIEADGNYVHLHVGNTAHLLRETLTSLETQLDPEKFLRISRSILVNIDRIKELQSLFYGDFAVILRDGTRLTMSRNYRERLESLVVRPK
ncbi:MAG: LytTR family DNA-binding domain-containing protein [Verrucomicrobiota bacterium]|jgi:two-component system, LytTR family, response regulator